jgi:hypothetical protein
MKAKGTRQKQFIGARLHIHGYRLTRIAQGTSLPDKRRAESFARKVRMIERNMAECHNVECSAHEESLRTCLNRLPENRDDLINGIHRYNAMVGP